jgi:hypothetical protein
MDKIIGTCRWLSVAALGIGLVACAYIALNLRGVNGAAALAIIFGTAALIVQIASWRRKCE